MNYLTGALLAVIAYILWGMYQELSKKRLKESKEDFMKYPLYSQEEIEHAHFKAQEVTLDNEAEKKQTLSMLEHEDKKIKKHSQFSKTYKDQVKKNIGTIIDSERAWEKFRFMVEGNLAILNSKKAIKEVEKEYDDKFWEGLFTKATEVEKRFKKWEQTVTQDRPQAAA